MGLVTREALHLLTFTVADAVFNFCFTELLQVRQDDFCEFGVDLLKTKYASCLLEHKTCNCIINARITTMGGRHVLFFSLIITAVVHIILSVI